MTVVDASQKVLSIEILTMQRKKHDRRTLIIITRDILICLSHAGIQLENNVLDDFSIFFNADLNSYYFVRVSGRFVQLRSFL